MKKTLLLLSLAAFALPSFADIYKCADDAGHITFSNVQAKGCKRLNLDSDGPSSSGTAKAPRAAANPSPANFPRVDGGTQRARDNDRRAILEQELAAEQKNLEAAKKDVTEQEAMVQPGERNVGGGINGAKVAERVQSYKDKVQLHERNIEAIRKEIANLR